MASNADIARAAAQPAGKVATDEDLSAPFRPDTSGGIPDSQHVDPLAQAHGMRENDPNYIPGVPDNLAARPPQTNTPAAAAMEALPTGLAGGVKYGDTSGPKASGQQKVDPGTGNARRTA